MLVSFKNFVSRYLIVVACAAAFSASAQGWQHFYGAVGDQRFFAIKSTPDHGILALGSTADSTGAPSDVYFVHTDSTGHILNERSWGSPDFPEYGLALFLSDTSVWALGNKTWNEAGPFGQVQRSAQQWKQLDITGHILNSGEQGNYITYANDWSRFNDNFLIAGSDYGAIVDAYFPYPAATLLDANGHLLWSRRYDNGRLGNAVSVIQTSPTKALLACFGNLDPGETGFLVKIDSTGAELMRKSIPLDSQYFDLKKMILLDNGHALCAGRLAPGDIFLVEIDTATLDTLKTVQVAIPGDQTLHAVRELGDGSLIVAGESTPQGAMSRDAFLAKINAAGQLIWFKTYSGLKGDIFWDVQEKEDATGFIVAGQTASFSQQGDLQAWLLETDPSGQVWSNRISGKVAWDQVQNCQVDSLDEPLHNWIVTAAGTAGQLYALTDTSGSYEIAADTGQWFVSVLPTSGYWMPCEDSIPLTFNQINDTVGVSFPVQTLYDCPLLDVDLSTPFLRQCFENTYYVHYANYGTSAAHNALIQVILDPYLTFTQSSVPVQQSGDTLFFQIDDVSVQGTGDFSFGAFLACDSVVTGQMLCSEAHIFPDSLCEHFSPVWDGSNLEVSGYCAGDSIVFTVTNTGLAMQDAVDYIITEDQIIFRRAALQLGPGQDTTFIVYPLGATVAILVTQTAGHPGNSQPMLLIEGCGGLPFSTGYGFQFAQNDGDPAVDIECRPAVASFDPNDKTGIPLGVSSTGIIDDDTKIEYLIRFQNTGTDTAFRVEVIDTLSETLDPARLRVGAASHPFRWYIDGPGVLHFVFQPISLPDSAASWAASQGFIKFSIAPRIGLADGTVLRNTASIVFDHNAPVATNTTLHTIGKPFEHLISKTHQPNITQSTRPPITISPNPAHDFILVNLGQLAGSGRLQLEVRNLQGQTVTKVEFESGQTVRIQINQLPPAPYTLDVKDRNGHILTRVLFIKI